ncbi:MAG TPA: hypothetical protein EYH28_07525 [Anaerolineaceae bacterium]|nr:hypothetical protein [Anaerolineaceae bacterium]
MPKARRRRLGSVWILFWLLGWLVGVPTQAAPLPQPVTPEERAQALLDEMTPTERVGQLFLVAVSDTDLTEGSPVYNLIVQRHIGGVILRRDAPGSGDIPETPRALQEFTRRMQGLAWRAQFSTFTDPVSGASYHPTFVPLFVAVAQEGDGYPWDTLLSPDLTPLPSPLALGATWSPEVAQEVGQVLGRELAALGFNMLFGPPLDVATTPSSESPGDLGVHTFGGDPYWVGLLGQGVVQGLHEGAQRHLAVVAKHFPGYGASDRDPTQEVATVRKSLEQLKQIELAPFFAVTGNAATPDAVADGLLTSHLRYQGFQGNIRATTRPVSLDAQAMALLMGLQPFTTWRQNGGLLVSDDLGSPALRRFYDPTGQTFSARQVARDAFLAGNDLLILGDMTEPGDDSPYPAINRVLDFFVQKYGEDPAFARQVDEAVLHILTAKARLYPSFALSAVQASPDDLAVLGQGEEVVFRVAQAAATLISPGATDLEAVLPQPPGPKDRLLFLTDAVSYQACETCPVRWALAPDALSQAVLRLYGPDGSGVIAPRRVVNLTYDDVLAWLQEPDQHPEVPALLRQSDWVIVAALDADPQRPSSLAFKELLNQRPDLLQDKKVVAFAFNAPYYFDATDLSKISAYYGLYSKAPPFVEMAARLLFREVRPQGASPVSIEGIGYDLITATSPDPEQVIPLTWDFPSPTSAAEAVTPEPGQPLTVASGTAVPIRTGVIVDHNGHPVPDGTVVRFLLTGPGGEGVQQQVTVTTISGVARASLQPTQPGTWEIRAQSEPAYQSEVLLVQVGGELEEEATLTVAPPATPTAPVPPATVEQPGLAPVPHTQVDWEDYLTALALSVILAWLVYRRFLRQGQVRWGLRYAALLLSGGMLGYLYLALQLPGSTAGMVHLGRGMPVLSAAVGWLLGVLVGLLWQRRAAG